jgi:hypothetical protein
MAKCNRGNCKRQARAGRKTCAECADKLAGYVKKYQAKHANGSAKPAKKAKKVKAATKTKPAKKAKTRTAKVAPKAEPVVEEVAA